MAKDKPVVHMEATDRDGNTSSRTVRGGDGQSGGESTSGGGTIKQSDRTQVIDGRK